MKKTAGRGRTGLWLMLILALLVVWMTACSSSEQAVNRGFDAKVNRVIDGDTLEIIYGDNKKETIRLLLVDTPETVHPTTPVQPFGPEASQYAKDTLADKKVQIELDVSDRDKYGRLLAYVWIEDRMFNELLLEQGLARVAYIYPPNVKYVDQFRDVQKKAQLAGMGIWSIENYALEDGFAEGVAIDSMPGGGASKAARSSATNSAGKVAVKESDKPAESAIVYANCKEVRAAGKAPLRKGEPGYNSKLDGDGDGIACE
jgi:micrococcal nuclease